jgi:magnesium-transporting ATPase (P-type)
MSNNRADSLFSNEGIEDQKAVINPKQGNYSLAIVRRFDFSSKLQRMSVIVKNFLD